MNATVRSADIKREVNMTDKYKDIINLPYPTAKTRPVMSVYNRAAQFSPFAALTGYEEAVKETARFTNEKAELDEYHIAMINDKLNAALENKDQSPVVSVIFFKPDSRKKGGEYLTVTGTIRRIDKTDRTVVFTDGTMIPVNLIYDITEQP